MKKMMMILVSLLMVSAATFAADDKKTNNVEPFEGVSVNAPVRIRFVYGEDYKVDVTSADSLAATAIRMVVEDGVLKIRPVDGNEELKDVCVTIVSPTEPRLSVGRHLEVKSTARNSRTLASR